MISGRSRPRPEPTTIDTSCVVVRVARPPSRSSTIAWRLAAGHQLVGQRRSQRFVGLERAGEPEQLVLDLVERALGAGDLEQRPGVALDACVTHRAAPTFWMKDSISSLVDVVGQLAVHDVLGGRRRQAGDLGAQLVDAATRERGDVGVGLGLEVGDLGVEPCRRRHASSAAACSSASASSRARSASRSPSA